jgi:hypothetical protein
MSDDPVPAYFTWRYILWLTWSNAVTILATVQIFFQAITLDPTLVDRTTAHWVAIANLALMAIISQVKKNNPPGPPPTKGNSP